MIPLSPIDHIFFGAGSYPIQFAFAYSAHLDADVLKQSLAQALDSYRPLRSRLVAMEHEALGLEDDPGGARFSVQQRDESLSGSDNVHRSNHSR